MLRIEKLINFNMTCTWTFQQIHSCMGICFSCMFTNNCEHFRINDFVLFTRIIQWEGTAYSIIIINTILLNCILNDIVTGNFYFSVSYYVCTLLF